MRNNLGFTMVELLFSLTLIAFVIGLSVSAVNFKSRSADNTETELVGAFSSIEAATQNYLHDKSSYPTGLTDASFVPVYLFPPRAPSVFDRTYGVSGFSMARQTGQASPNNGYYVCAKVSVDNATDYKFEAIKQVAARVSVNKFFYNTACPALTNAADPAGATTLYPTYWITRE